MTTQNTDWTSFVELIKKKYEGEKQNQRLDKNEYRKLLNFKTIIENNLLYNNKKLFIDLCRNFIGNLSIDFETADSFTYQFQGLYESFGNQVRNLTTFTDNEEENQEKLIELKKSFKPINDKNYQLSSILGFVYGSCDMFNPGLSIESDTFINEKQLEAEVKGALEAIKKYNLDID